MAHSEPHSTAAGTGTATATTSAPLGLRDMLNSQPERHDSAYYGTPSEASSKRMDIESPQSSPSPHATGWLTVTAPPADTSGTSFVGPNGYPSHSHHHDTKVTPSPTSTHLAPQSIISHSTATSSMSLASIVSPTTPANLDPNRGYRSGYDSHNAMETDGERRESVDGRMAQGFTDMRINNGNSLPPSPYAPHAQNSAASQRIPRQKFDLIQSHRMSNGYQPSADRTPIDIRIDSRTQRQAPTITGPTQGIIARAAEPTKGQAWAFPEDERSGSYTESRRSSLADSINSSQFTSESRLPAGQLRLDGQSTDGHRLSSTSNEYLPMHHHSLQHKKISDLQEESRPAGSQPYSRTPELRQSHKLAERKRRTEMKELFEQLREMMPQERGAKASKWEILTKAISEIKRLNDNIRNMSIHYNSAVNEIENHRREIHSLRMENAELRAKINSHSMGHPSQSSSHGPSHGPSHGAPHPSSIPPSSVPPPPSSHYGGSDYNSSSSRPELPPLRSISGQLPPPGPGPDSMTGVQYDSHRPPFSLRTLVQRARPAATAAWAAPKSATVVSQRFFSLTSRLANEEFGNDHGFGNILNDGNRNGGGRFNNNNNNNNNNNFGGRSFERPPVDPTNTFVSKTATTVEASRREKRVVHITNLPYNTRWEDVFRVFGYYGEIERIKFPRSGSCFVHFVNSNSVPKSIQALNNTYMHRRRIFVQEPEGEYVTKTRFVPELEPCETIYLGNLPYDMTEQELVEILEPVGEVVETRVPKDAGGLMRGYAHVEFANIEQAIEAVEKLKGIQMRGRNVAVNYAVRKKNQDHEQQRREMVGDDEL